MIGQYETLYSYLDALLRLQSDAAEMFEHTGVLGTVRENFLVQQINERVDSVLIHTGQVISCENNAGQVDIIIRKKNTLNPAIGGQVRLVASDCAAVIEVKSNATGTDLRDFNEKSRIIKDENPNVVCGFFCYKLECKKETILKRIGYRFDKEYLGFEFNSKLVNAYPFVDFIMCIDDEEEYVGGTSDFYNKYFFAHKNSEDITRFDLILKPPFSFYFLTKIKEQSMI